MIPSTRILRTLGPVEICGIAGVLTAQTPANPASNVTRLGSLPDNPCDLLTREQVAIATGLEINGEQRKPDLMQIVEAQNAHRDPAPGTICVYETRSEFGSLTIAIPPLAERAAVSYRQARDQYFRTYPCSGRMISGVGEEAWLAGGGFFTY